MTTLNSHPIGINNSVLRHHRLIMRRSNANSVLRDKRNILRIRSTLMIKLRSNVGRLAVVVIILTETRTKHGLNATLVISEASLVGAVPRISRVFGNKTQTFRCKNRRVLNRALRIHSKRLNEGSCAQWITINCKILQSNTHYNQ